MTKSANFIAIGLLQISKPSKLGGYLYMAAILNTNATGKKKSPKYYRKNVKSRLEIN